MMEGVTNALSGVPCDRSASFFGKSDKLLGGDTPGCAGGIFESLGPCQVQATIGLGGTYSFQWTYATADVAGPGGDIFGVIVDSARISLSDLGGAIMQNGLATFTSLSSFGFFINCTDCIGVSATANISNFTFVGSGASVPEPPTTVLMLAGILGLGLIGRQKRSGRV
jgi:hypothetical protein